MLDSQAAVQFIDKILEEKGVEGLEEQERLQLRNNLLQSLQDRVYAKLLESLSPTQLTHFEHLVDTNQLDKLQHYLTEQGINVAGILAACMGEFRARYLGA